MLTAIQETGHRQSVGAGTACRLVQKRDTKGTWQAAGCHGMCMACQSCHACESQSWVWVCKDGNPSHKSSTHACDSHQHRAQDKTGATHASAHKMGCAAPVASGALQKRLQSADAGSNCTSMQCVSETYALLCILGMLAHAQQHMLLLSGKNAAEAAAGEQAQGLGLPLLNCASAHPAGTCTPMLLCTAPCRANLLSCWVRIRTCGCCATHTSIMHLC